MQDAGWYLTLLVLLVKKPACWTRCPFTKAILIVILQRHWGSCNYSKLTSLKCCYTCCSSGSFSPSSYVYVRVCVCSAYRALELQEKKWSVGSENFNIFQWNSQIMHVQTTSDHMWPFIHECWLPHVGGTGRRCLHCTRKYRRLWRLSWAQYALAWFSADWLWKHTHSEPIKIFKHVISNVPGSGGV